MPVVVRRRDGKFRVVEKATGRIAAGSQGGARDSGGYETREQAERTARAINAGIARRRKR